MNYDKGEGMDSRDGVKFCINHEKSEWTVCVESELYLIFVSNTKGVPNGRLRTYP